MGLSQRLPKQESLCEEFEAVAPGVFGVEAPNAGERIIVGDLDAAREQCLAQLLRVVGNERGMGFLRGTEISFDADVNLLGATAEPASAARAKRFRLFYLLHSEERTIKIARGGFAALWSGNLNVIEV